jgi:hypothetical protein
MRVSVGKAAVYMLSAVVAAGLFAALFLYSTTRREVQIAQHMMDDATRLQVGKSSLIDVLAFARRYNGEVGGTTHGQPCLESDCLVIVAPNTNDFWERHPKLGYVADRISRRGWHFSLWMWIKDGKLTAIEQWFGYSTPQISPFVITTISRPGPRLCRNPFFRLHHTFAAYEDAKHFAVWVDSAAAREKEMLRLNLTCASSFTGCKDVAQMAPTAWARYESDRSLVNSDKWAEAAQDNNCR